jgi:hypothetical protein
LHFILVVVQVALHDLSALHSPIVANGHLVELAESVVVDHFHLLLEDEDVYVPAVSLELEHLIVHSVVSLDLEQVVLHVVRLAHELALVSQVVEDQVLVVLSPELHVANEVSISVEQHEALLYLHQYQVILSLYGNKGVELYLWISDLVRRFPFPQMQELDEELIKRDGQEQVEVPLCLTAYVLGLLEILLHYLVLIKGLLVGDTRNLRWVFQQLILLFLYYVAVGRKFLALSKHLLSIR